MSKSILIGKKLCIRKYTEKSSKNDDKLETKSSNNNETKIDTKQNDIDQLARKKLLEDAQRVSELSKTIGISAAIKKPKLENKLFVANVIRHTHFSNESKLKRLQDQDKPKKRNK